MSDMVKIKNTTAYKLYKKSEENVGSGKAAEKFYEEALSEILRVVDYGETGVYINKGNYHRKAINDAADIFKKEGFTVFTEIHKLPRKIFIGWDFSNEE